MEPICKRAFRRDDNHARILYADNSNGRKQHFLDAVMYNSSEGGMYFEARESLQPGTDLWIKMAEYSPEIHGVYAYNGYRAEVMWCRKIYNDEDKESHYGVGVRFMINVCGQCGQKVAYSDIHRLENFLFLCTQCVNQLRSLPDGKIKECCENYLLGNVV